MADDPHPLLTEAAATERALRHISQIRFHQRFVLAPNPSVGIDVPLRVTYADCDYRRGTYDGDDGPTLMVLGGMYGGRYLPIGSTDALARKHGVRVIIADKFGQGGTDHIAMTHRIPAFMYLVQSLLEHLGVKHVAFLSHSAGTLYMLNALVSQRHFLHPTRPSIWMLSPWVHPNHSGALSVLRLVPDSIMGKSDSIIGWVNNKMGPALSLSTNFAASVSNLVSSGTNEDPDIPNETALDACPDHDPSVEYGPGEVTGSQLSKQMMQCIFIEETKGGAEEALMCLKRGDNPNWGACEDYDEVLGHIVENERVRLGSKAAGTGSGSPQVDDAADSDKTSKLSVRVVFPESDALSGKQGQQYFDDVWKRHCAAGDVISYESESVKDADHDSIGDLRFGVLDRVLADVRRRWTTQGNQGSAPSS